MKVGKEGIYSSILAVENWYKRNIKNDLFKQKKIISYWLKYLNKKNYQGIDYEVIPDPTGNKINRLRIIVESKSSNFSAQSLAYYLEKNNPSIYVRDDLIHLNHFELDTCNLKINQEKIVMIEMDKIIKKLINKKIKNNINHSMYKKLSMKSWLKWPD
jgi:L-seryl-tRNA(Ser) seleniumtransferase